MAVHATEINSLGRVKLCGIIDPDQRLSGYGLFLKAITLCNGGVMLIWKGMHFNEIWE